MSWCCPKCGEHWTTHGTACKPRSGTVTIPCQTADAQREASELTATLRTRITALEQERDTAHAAGVAEATERCAKIARESSVEGDYLSRLFRASTTPPTTTPNEPGIPNLDSPEEEGRDGG